MYFSSQLLQYVITGFTVGGVYALIAVGFVTIYNVTGILNFAQGEFVMLGAMLMAVFYKAGFSVPLGFLLSVLIVTLVGAFIERAALYPARRASVITLIIITIGASISVRGIALILWGTDPYKVPAFTPGPPVQVLGAVMVRQSFWVLGLAALVMLGLYIFFERTIIGKALRACVINRTAARLMGISPPRMSLISFCLSAGLGAGAGIVVTPMALATYDMGLMLGLKGFVAAVLGGMTSAPGAIIGGFLLGILESLGAGLISSGYRDAIAFFILLVVLFVKPSGLLGITGSKRV